MKLRTWAARFTARLAVRWHPHLALRNQHPNFAFMEDGLGTLHSTSFTDQPRFQRAYALGKATGSWGSHELRWRIHVLLWCAATAVRLGGAFVECGVHRGGFARSIIDYTDFARMGQDYYVFDTFCGFDLPQLSDGEQQTVALNYQYDDSYNDVAATFAKMPFVKLVRGVVPQSLFQVGPVAFLSIDMNCTVPEIAALRFFWPSLLPGALVVLDDYGFALHHEQKDAFDQLAQELGVDILALPTGQGLICKSADKA